MTSADQVLEDIVFVLRQNDNVQAIWLAGSHGRGEADEFSDIDIWVALNHGAVAPVVDDPLGFIHTVTPTIWHILAPSIAPEGGAFIGSWVPMGHEFVQVDWYIVLAETAKRDQQTLLVYGDAPVREPVDLPASEPYYVRLKVEDNLKLALQMISNMVKHARRGRFWRAADHARHADNCLLAARSFLATGATPDFVASQESILPEPPPSTASEVQDLAMRLLEETERLNALSGHGLDAAIASMRSVVSQWRDSD